MASIIYLARPCLGERSEKPHIHPSHHLFWHGVSAKLVKGGRLAVRNRRAGWRTAENERKYQKRGDWRRTRRPAINGRSLRLCPAAPCTHLCTCSTRAASPRHQTCTSFSRNTAGIPAFALYRTPQQYRSPLYCEKRGFVFIVRWMMVYQWLALDVVNRRCER